MKLLAAEGALATLSGHRRQQVWNAAALHAPPELLQEAPVDEDFLELPEAPEGEDVLWDYASVGLTLRSQTRSQSTDIPTADRPTSGPPSPRNKCHRKQYPSRKGARKWVFDAEKLKAKRAALGSSQRDMAKLLHTSSISLSK